MILLSTYLIAASPTEKGAKLFSAASTSRTSAEGMISLNSFANLSQCPENIAVELLLAGSQVGEKRRPPYRWLLLGPRRSGTYPSVHPYTVFVCVTRELRCLHVDPLGTSAWNVVVAGRKRWILFEPGTSKAIAKGTHLYDVALEDDEPINYFVDILPRIRHAYPTARRIECVQQPGETIFIPGGWWHAVLNLDDSIGVTQNFVSRANFDMVWDKARIGRRAMARKWFRALCSHPNQDIRVLQVHAATRPPFFFT